MTNLTIRIVKHWRLSFFIYTFVSLFLIFIYVAIFPSFKDQGEKLNQLMEVYPETMLKAFGIDQLGNIFGSVEAFVATEHFSLMFQILLIALTISFTSWAVSGQIDKKTLGYLLSLPMRRTQLFAALYLSGLLMTVVFTTLTIYATPAFAGFFQVKTQLANYPTLLMLSLAIGWAIFGIGMLSSVLFNERGKAIFLPLGILTTMYVLNLLSSLKESLSDLKYFSFFHYYNAIGALTKNQVPDYSYLVFAATAAVTTLLAFWLFQRKDISV